MRGEGNKYISVFDDYFNRQQKAHNMMYGHNPSMPYNPNADSRFYVTKPDENGYAEWKPLQVDSVNWDLIEQELGIKLNDDIKYFYGTYKFLDLSGEIDKKFCSIYPFGVSSSIEEDILNAYSHNFHKELELFCIGNLESETQIFYSNIDRSVYLSDEDLDIELEKFKFGLFEIIKNMKVC